VFIKTEASRQIGACTMGCRKGRNLTSDLDPNNANDRATALVTATRLEHEIERAIQTHFVQLSEDQISALFDGDGPLSNLAAKVRLAHALGIFGKRTKTDLDIIRNVRNVFAHSWKNVGFADEAVAEACGGLSMKGVTQNNAAPSDPKQRYLNTILLVVLYIRQELEKKTAVSYQSSIFQNMMD